MGSEEIEVLRQLHKKGYAFRIKGTDPVVFRSFELCTLFTEGKINAAMDLLQDVLLEKVTIYKPVQLLASSSASSKYRRSGNVFSFPGGISSGVASNRVMEL